MEHYFCCKVTSSKVVTWRYFAKKVFLETQVFFIEKETRVFPVNFAKPLRTPIL